MGTMEAALSALRKDAFASAVEVIKAVHILHESFDSVQLPGGHLAHFLNSFLSASSTFKIEVTSFWATKKEGLPHTPKWRMKQTLLDLTICFR